MALLIKLINNITFHQFFNTVGIHVKSLYFLNRNTRYMSSYKFDLVPKGKHTLKQKNKTFLRKYCNILYDYNGDKIMDKSSPISYNKIISKNIDENLYYMQLINKVPTLLNNKNSELTDLDLKCNYGDGMFSYNNMHENIFHNIFLYLNRLIIRFERVEGLYKSRNSKKSDAKSEH